MPMTSLIGRQREIAMVCEMLERADVRLLTLTGPGGVGKTRLAMAAAEHLEDRFRDGVVAVSLASVHDPTLVVSTIVDALGLPETRNQSHQEQLVSFLSDADILLVLDNFEHVVEAAPLLSNLLADCHLLNVLVTSRSRLRLHGEHEIVVPPLALPTSDPENLAALSECESIALFVQRANDRRSGFTLNETNAASVVDICNRLEGLPLAIELAAARTAVLTPKVMQERFDQILPLLADGPRDAPARQRTIRETITWSYQILSPHHQQVLRRLAVFTDGWSIDAAEAVLPDDVGGPDAVLTALEVLLDSSLVSTIEHPDGAQRFAMLDVVEEFVREELVASGEWPLMRDRHADWVLGIAPPAWVDQASAYVTVTRWQPAMRAEEANVRAALSWLAKHPHRTRDFSQLAMGLTVYWQARGTVREGLEWLELAMAANRGDEQRISWWIQCSIAHLLHTTGADDRAMELLEDGMAFAREHRDDGLLSAFATLAGLILQEHDAFDRSHALLSEALVVATRSGIAAAAAQLQFLLALVAAERGDLVKARELVEDSLRGFRAANAEGWGIGNALEISGVVYLLSGENTEAVAAFQESVRELGKYGDTTNLILAFSGLSAALLAMGHAAASARLVGILDGLCQRTGIVPYLPERDILDETRAVVRLTLGEERFSAIHGIGTTMSLAPSIRFALDLDLNMEVDASQAASPPISDPLTPREHDVLRLLIDGKSNQEIAAALFISPNTAANHVANIMNKLRLESRTAVAAWAARHGFLE